MALPDDRPKLIAGIKFEKTAQAGMFAVRDPKGQAHLLPHIQALLAQSCNGARTLAQLREMTTKQGSAYTVEMIADFLRKLRSLGLVEEMEKAPGDLDL